MLPGPPSCPPRSRSACGAIVGTLSWTQSRLTDPLHYLAKNDEGSGPLILRVSQADISDARRDTSNQFDVPHWHCHRDGLPARDGIPPAVSLQYTTHPARSKEVISSPETGNVTYIGGDSNTRACSIKLSHRRQRRHRGYITSRLKLQYATSRCPMSGRPRYTGFAGF